MGRRVFSDSKEENKRNRNVFRDKTNNSVIERLHGTERDREKVMRVLKKHQSWKDTEFTTTS
ncbi:MAG TPA: hypothetical protein EYP68_04395 [Candidatus Korarchaeota archaeon]|nr:hypothetical protein [Candidatus Korarchaeota archaeon]